MFEAKITQQKLSEALDVADALVEEAVLQFTPRGLTISVVDPANVGMAVVTVPESDFSVYDTDGALLGVFLDKLSDVLGMMDGDDELGMELDDETRKLHLSAAGLEYTMALIDPKSIEAMDDVPELPFGAEVTAETTVFKRAVKAADMVSDHMSFRVADGEFSLEASGDSDDIDYDVKDAQISPGANDTIEDASARFSLSYLKEMFKAVSGDYVVASVAQEMPVRLDFKLAHSDGSGMFFVAPRISDN